MNSINKKIVALISFLFIVTMIFCFVKYKNIIGKYNNPSDLVSTDSESHDLDICDCNHNNTCSSKCATYPKAIFCSCPCEQSIGQSNEQFIGQSNNITEDINCQHSDLPILVNPTNQIPPNFTPNLVDIGDGFKFDSQASKYLIKMINNAKNDNIYLHVVSAYRSNKRQSEIFNNKISMYKKNGYSDKDAYIATSKYIAIPGTSEHALGLAVDLNSLEENFDTTPEYNWLINNCAKYGFILRYSKDKTDITKIAYEPWHYRYVGQIHAQKIMSQGICLEEYLSSHQ